MKRSISTYLDKRADLERWPLHAVDTEALDTVVVIPCLAERDTIFATLRSLAQNASDRLQHTLIICVVNNRTPEPANTEDIADNQALLEDLRCLIESRDSESIEHESLLNLRIAFIDASSQDNEIPSKDGVGLARKIGMDWAVSLLETSATEVQVICCLDGDTTVEPNYLEAVHDAFVDDNAWAGVVHFEHVLPENSTHRSAIVDYEIFLRCHVHGLRDAGSPYAFHTVGSTMVCTPEAYVAVSGMNRRQAAEDFYFLQQLAKTGGIQMIATTTVYPSARTSHRVPFGTGRRVSQVINDGDEPTYVYHPAVYEELRDCYRVADSKVEDLNDMFPNRALREKPLYRFLRDQGFDSAWSRIRKASQSYDQRNRQYFTWFDAFRALKLIHFLRDEQYPNVDGLTAARMWIPEEAKGFEDPEQFLMWLRGADRVVASGPPMGLG